MRGKLLPDLDDSAVVIHGLLYSEGSKNVRYSQEQHVQDKGTSGTYPAAEAECFRRERDVVAQRPVCGEEAVRVE